MPPRLNMNKIAKALGARRGGKVRATGGYFGALQLLADITSRVKVPKGGGRPTDSRWTERRLLPLAPRTLARLEAITATVRRTSGVNLEPMQVAGLLLERTMAQFTKDQAADVLHPKRHSRP